VRTYYIVGCKGTNVVSQTRNHHEESSLFAGILMFSWLIVGI
jgi:hypothetical protein